MQDTYTKRIIGKISYSFRRHSYWSMDNDDPSWRCTVRTHCSGGPSPASSACRTSCSTWPSRPAAAPAAPSSSARSPGQTTPPSSAIAGTRNIRSWKLWNRLSLKCSKGDQLRAGVFHVSLCTNRKCKNSCSKSCHRAPVIQSVEIKSGYTKDLTKIARPMPMQS